MSDEAPDTERPAPEDRLADALDAVADIIADMSGAQAEGLERLERLLAGEIGGVKGQQERDYARVTRLDESHQVHLKSIDAGISKILALLEPIPDRMSALCERVSTLEKGRLNGSVPHQ